MKTLKAKLTLLTLATLMHACGDGGNSTPTTPAPPPPANASWSLILEDVTLTNLITRIGVTPQLRLSESNGVGYHINFIRFEVVATGGTDRYEFGSDRIDVGSGGNFVTAGSPPVMLTGTYIVNNWRGTLVELRITVSVTDTNGKSAELVVRQIGDEARALQESLYK